jgi:hypothetical protein
VNGPIEIYRLAGKMSKKKQDRPYRATTDEMSDLDILRHTKITRKEINQVICPDCGAWLEIVSSEPLPDDIKIQFIKHRI